MTEEDCNSGSEVSECESSEGENKTSKSHKRRKKTKGSTKKVKTSNDLEGEDDPKEAVETKIDVDALWAGMNCLSFMLFFFLYKLDFVFFLFRF